MARSTAQTNEQALAAFMAAKDEIDRLLTSLAAMSAEHFHASPDEITWGHVGTANHIRERLHEIASFANGTRLGLKMEDPGQFCVTIDNHCPD